MLLAELEVWHTRPLAPTRRLALGNLVLPVDPAPGFGGLLLGAVVAGHLRDVPDELVPDVHRLIHQIEQGQRIVQPRMRHRFQVDRHGLALSTHRLVGDGDALNVDFHTTGTGLAQVLGAIYAVERLEVSSRQVVVPLLHKAMRWKGRVGPELIAHLAGTASVDPGHAGRPAGVGARHPRLPRRQPDAVQARRHGAVPDQDALGPPRPRRRPDDGQHGRVRARRGPPHPHRRRRRGGQDVSAA